jgi:tripartite-type tricarboxylate transporter receptor subunit TctC
MIYLLLVISVLIGGCTSMKTSTPVAKSKYPEKPITVIVPFSVGGGMDLIARELEKHALKHFGHPLIVVNKPGGGGSIGWNELASSDPNGYTLGITGIEVILQPLYGPTKYHYPTALEPLAQIASTPIVLAVSSKQPWQTLDDLIAYAKSHQTELKFSHSGVGSNPHIVGEMFGKAAGIAIQQVPFRGVNDAATTLLGGHVDFTIINPAILKGHVKAGTVRILAVCSENRLSDPVFSSVPTFKEQGLNIISDIWFGIGAPKGLPLEVKGRLATGFREIVADPEFRKDLEATGIIVNYLGPQESLDKWIADSDRLNKEIQETGILELIQSQKK